MLNGLRSAFYPVQDIQTASQWYEQVFGQAPYFTSDNYIGFELGGFEFGLLNAAVTELAPSIAGAYAVWGVDDIEDTLSRLTDKGAVIISPIAEVGGGIKCADIEDPFGNRLGIIENPIFDITKCK